MCGIAGTIDGSPDRNKVYAICEVLRHRGPDDQGTFTALAGQSTVTLAHTRLRVIDVSQAGHQPMVSGNLALVFNGEIYNYRELRHRFERAGETFQSGTDSEVILTAYRNYGPACIEHLHGMFAFAIWDSEERRLFLARDRIGKKPLFYYCDGRSFAFGSEIKAILASLDRTPGLDWQALDDYLTYLYVPYPKTIFESIRQVPPASCLCVKVRDNGIDVAESEYWNPLNAPPPIACTSKDFINHFDELFAETVRCRLVSDVPIGVLLSGGMDSSSIAAMMAQHWSRNVPSFSIGYNGLSTYDEIAFAQKVATHLGCTNEVLYVEPSAAGRLAEIVWHFDQPFGNPTAVLTTLLAERTRQSVTVALAGDGGDELLGGYPRYVGAYLGAPMRSLPQFLLRRVFPWIGGCISDDANGYNQFRRVREFLEAAGLPLIEAYLQWVGYFGPEDKAQLYTDQFKARVRGHDSGDFLRDLFRDADDLEPLNRLSYVDVKSFLCCNVLECADRMSMAHGLELRSPFTDHRLVEFAMRTPYRLKYRYGRTKWLLRQAMRPYLPPEILNRRKVGFSAPVGSWLAGELRDLPVCLLSESAVRRRGFFEPAAVASLLNSHGSGKRDYSLRIWALLMLEVWSRIYLDGRAVDSVQADLDGAVRTQAKGAHAVFTQI